jgi:hypothetical protein
MYTPSPVPQDGISAYLSSELQAIARAFTSQVPFIYLQTVNVAPTKPRVGLCVLADGTHWNPGSGAGVYCYRGGAWTFLG